MGGNPTEYGLIDAKNSFFKKEGVSAQSDTTTERLSWMKTEVKLNLTRWQLLVTFSRVVSVEQLVRKPM